jgi:hypothetical protein
MVVRLLFVAWLPEDPSEKYARRPRHRTREDRYEYKDVLNKRPKERQGADQPHEYGKRGGVETMMQHLLETILPLVAEKVNDTSESAMHRNVRDDSHSEAGHRRC